MMELIRAEPRRNGSNGEPYWLIEFRTDETYQSIVGDGPRLDQPIDLLALVFDRIYTIAVIGLHDHSEHRGALYESWLRQIIDEHRAERGLEPISPWRDPL